MVETLDGQRARDYIDELSRKYVGKDYANPIGPHGRVVYVIQPEKVNTAKSLGRR